MENRPSRTERRIKWILLGIVIVVVAIVAFLYSAPELRLSLAQHLHIVPGVNATKVASSDDYRLIVITEPVKGQLSGVRYRQEARYLLHYGPPMTATDLRSGKTIQIPLTGHPTITINGDRTKLLLTVEQGTTKTYATLDMTNDSAARQDAEPAGGWTSDVYNPHGACPGASPHDKYTVCLFKGGLSNTRYLFGDWEADVRLFGTTNGDLASYRGRGLLPIVGFAPDDSALYIYGEYDIWKLTIPANK